MKDKLGCAATGVSSVVQAVLVFKPSIFVVGLLLNLCVWHLTNAQSNLPLSPAKRSESGIRADQTTSRRSQASSATGKMDSVQSFRSLPTTSEPSTSMPTAAKSQRQINPMRVASGTNGPPAVQAAGSQTVEQSDAPTQDSVETPSDFSDESGIQMPNSNLGMGDQLSGQFDSFSKPNAGVKIGSDFFGLGGDFNQGIVIRNDQFATKIGGYIKVDLIHDFDPIGSTDLFNVQTIEIGAPPRTNTRIHARQTRLNLDTRWNSEWGPVRFFVEGDFFFNQAESSELGTDRFRLRHAMLEYGKWTVGQTWTTFSDIAASPATLDFEGQVASVATRRTQIRWTQPIEGTALSFSLAIEDPFTVTEIPKTFGEPRTETPDAVARIRLSRPNYQMQVAGVVRELGFQQIGEPVISATASGTNFTQVLSINDTTKLYSELLWGTGIASFLGSPDIIPTLPGEGQISESIGWMVGVTHEWTPKLYSNLTYAENRFTRFPGVSPAALNATNYLAVNLIAAPIERFEYGIEYLYGKRENFSGESGSAQRIQAAVTVFLQ